MTFKQQLIDMNACHEAVVWVGRKSLKTAWSKCERGDWMLWLAGKLDIDRKLLVLAACDCAEPALKLIPEGEDRPRQAIQTARDWCNGLASLEDVRNAANAANAAANAADVAAYAAADVAAYAANAANAADAAYAAAYAAYAGYAAAGASADASDLVRARIPFEAIEKAMRENT